jgi:serine/threonine protein kinase
MATERVQRQIERLLDEAEQAAGEQKWNVVRERAAHVLTFDPENEDGRALLAAAERGLGTSTEPSLDTGQPESFGGGRYEVRELLGEGGRKRVYLTRDSLLDREVAFALIKTEGLDEAGRERVQREARAMGRLGTHPNVVSVFDLGDDEGRPFIVTELMAGGDVEGLLEDADEHRLPLERALELATDVCQGLAFAHEQRIVHRDLKPGNVWLTPDGRAKIGDFGLAVALDRSRLTQAGTMVGTVSYMPPEQALGGEVGPRSDLYSLGAMLYELVCGRPPFLGDESVAIIGQHLNTPPVSPSWHREDCPQALEALILRLLEKDPTKRPESAEEVEEALAAIRTSEESRVEPAPPTPVQDPLYRRVFVGREQELGQVKDAFDQAFSGEGSLVMVAGEPGIGKTALCEQLSTYVSLRGGKTLVGHSYEEGSLSLPYLAFVEALRSYVLAREPEGLEMDLGTGAADVARIVSEVRDRLEVELRPAGDPQDDRFRLLQAVAAFLANASSAQPLLVVLEDLHWADTGTLELLQHVARNLQGTRLLLVATYRDVEVDRTHPLSGALAELRRGRGFERIALRGLTVDEVHRMYELIRGNEVPWSMAEYVHRQTEGNPLFIQEVLRYLIEEGLVVREDGRYVPQDAAYGATITVPEGLREVVGKRLSRLGEQANQVLTVASVIGREFELETLRRVAGVDEDVLVAALEEALAVAVLEERTRPGSIRYRFAHAFFREALYEELSAPRRLRQHQLLARALEEQYANRLEEHAAELAEHFSHSTDREDLGKAVHYSELAARRAMSVSAYREAARLLEQALEVQEVLDPEARARRCDLLVTLGDALWPAGEPRRVFDEVAPAALALAEELDDRARASRVCQLAIRAVQGVGGSPFLRTQEGANWLEAANRFAEEDSTDRVFADIAAADAHATLGGQEGREARETATRARERALRLDDPSVQGVADACWLYTASLYVPPTSELAEERLAVTRDLNRSLPASRRPMDQIRLLFWSTNIFLQDGLREQAEETTRQLKELADLSRAVQGEFLALGAAAWFPTADGRLDEAVGIDERVREHGEVTGLIEYSRLTRSTLPTARAQLYLGEIAPLEFALPLVQYFSTIDGPSEGQTAGDLLDRVITWRAWLEPGIEVPVPLLCTTGELAVAERHDGAARVVFDHLRDAPLASSGLLGGPVCIARLLGDLAAVLGDTKDARARYDEALDACTRMRLRPEKALTALGLAELLLGGDESEQTEARSHLDLALAELAELKMQPSLERALGLKALLEA